MYQIYPRMAIIKTENPDMDTSISLEVRASFESEAAGRTTLAIFDRVLEITNAILRQIENAS